MDTDSILRQLREQKRRLTIMIREIERGEEDESDTGVSFMGKPDKHSLALQTVKSFIADRVGNFEADLISATDMCETLHDPEYASLLQVDVDNFTPVMLGKMFKKLPDVDNVMTSYGGKTIRLCIIRDVLRYNTMPTSALREEYELQKQNCMCKIEA